MGRNSSGENGNVLQAKSVEGYMKKFKFVFVLLISSLGLAAVSDAQKADPFSEVSQLLSRGVQRGEVIGHSAMVFQNGEVVYYNQWGQRDRENDLPLKRDSIFRIYSMSKPITSVATMQLVEAGKIDLDAPISTYLPELGNLKVLQSGREVTPRREMTTRDLLRHTSGLTYGFFGNTKVDQAYRRKGVLITDRNVEQTVEKLSSIPLLNHPGQKFHYSASTDVLGRLIEVVSQERFDDYLRKNVFEPLEMNDTFFTVPDDKQDRFAQLYEESNGALRPKPRLASYRFLNANDFDSGGGGLCSTIDDYLKFCKMLLGDGTLGEHTILKKESIDEMFKNQLQDTRKNSRGFQFGLGFRVFREGDYGWGGAAGTRFWVHPEKQIAILYMVQISPYGNRRWGERFRSLVYEALE